MKATTREAMNLFMEGMKALAEVENSGIRIDTNYLEKTISDTEATIRTLEMELKEDKVWKVWKRLKGDRANLGSRAQLGDVIFGKMGYESKSQTATGRAKADASAFDHVDIPFVKKYLKVEQLKKANSTYLKGIRSEIIDGFVHPSYNLHTIVSFRSSCDRPNFQNIPSRIPELAKIIRRCYIPRKGRQLLEMDFSGIEVRVSACYHKDPSMIRYIEDPTTDMHRDQACELFILKQEEVAKKTTRDASKNMFVFPQFYGSVYFQCAPDIWEAMEKRDFRVGEDGITIREHLKKHGITRLGKCEPGTPPRKGTFEYHVQQVEQKMWNDKFPIYTQWKKDWWEAYLRKGEFQLYTGFICKGYYKRNEVLNYAVQGSAFHCLLWSLIKIHRWLKKTKKKTLIVGEIHDSLIFDLEPSEKDEVIAKATQIMTKDLPNYWNWLCVPLAVEAELAPVDASWLDKQAV